MSLSNNKNNGMKQMERNASWYGCFHQPVWAHWFDGGHRLILLSSLESGPLGGWTVCCTHHALNWTVDKKDKGGDKEGKIKGVVQLTRWFILPCSPLYSTISNVYNMMSILHASKHLGEADRGWQGRIMTLGTRFQVTKTSCQQS